MSELPGGRADDVFVFETSYAQRRLWFIEQLTPGSSAYNVPLALRLEGTLDTEVLSRSMQLLVDRHETLRTTFAVVDGRPVQIVAPGAELVLRLEDVAGAPSAEREARAIRRLIDDCQLPFDLERGPLFRLLLIRVTPELHLLGITMHHIISDGWSLGVLVREFVTLYVDLLGGGEGLLPDLPIQYADFALWQQEWLDGEQMDAQLTYWRRALAGANTSLELPTDTPRTEVAGAEGSRASFALPPAMTDGIRALAQASAATPFMVLLAVYGIFLARSTGQSDVVVGVPIANRQRPEAESLIGFLANTLPLRLDLSGARTFRDVLRLVKGVALGAFAHQDVPFERLVEDLRPPRHVGRPPLFQVMFVHHSGAPACIRISDLTLAPFELPRIGVRFDLTLVTTDDGDSIRGVFEYATHLFSAHRVGRMLGQFEALLAELVVDPDRGWRRAPWLSKEELEEQQRWANGPARTNSVSVVAQFEERARAQPDRTAITHGDAVFTFRWLEVAANRMASSLRRRGVQRGQVVGICVERSVELVVVLLGVLKAGAAWVPLDPEYPADRLRFMMKASGATLLLTQGSLAARFEDAANRVMVDEELRTTPLAPGPPLPAMLHDHDLAYVIFTSGSTGMPKGVLIEHGGLSNLAHAQIGTFAIDEASRVLQFAPSSFDASVSEIFTALLAGATLCLESSSVLQAGPGLLDALRERAITHVTLPPSLLAALAPASLPALLTLVVAGEACSAEVVTRWSGGRRLLNAYGPTETTVCATISAECHADRLGPPIGWPIANVSVRIQDPEGQLMPAGATGEIHVGGAGVARGYIGNPGVTAWRFRPDPFALLPGARSYATGDVGSLLQDGQIHFLGRADTQLKVRGFRIEPGEVEAALLRQPGIAEAAVVGRPGTGALVAYVVAQAGTSPPNSADARLLLTAQLPRHMIPSTISVVDALPRTPAGKIDRRALSLRDPGAGPTTPSTRIAAPPRNAMEAQLVAIWARLLEVPDVGVHDDFFELGGHSLLAIRMVFAVEAELGLRLPVSALFESSSVAAIASRLERYSATGTDQGIVQLSGSGLSQAVMFHALSGRLSCYAALSRECAGRISLGGVEAPGLTRGALPAATIEELAAHHVLALRGRCAARPTLVGWSFGGVVAFEVARQLERLGEPVGRVILLDTHLPTATTSAFSENDALLLFAGEIARLAGHEGVPPHLLHDTSRAPTTALIEWLHSSGVAPEARTEDVERELAVMTAHLKALAAYRPVRIAASVMLVRAGRGTTTESDLAGWAALSEGGLELCASPGDHFTLLQPPHVGEIATLLNAETHRVLGPQNATPRQA